jgi:hypothetical protein
MSATDDLVGALVGLVAAAADQSAYLRNLAEIEHGEAEPAQLRKQADQWGELADAGASALSRFRSDGGERPSPAPTPEIPVLAIGMD